MSESEDGSNDSGDAGFLMMAGAEGETLRPALLAWIPRVTGTLSLIGSAFILYDIWVVRRRQGRGRLNRRLYSELISAVSICDVFGSLGWMFSTLPMPKYVEDEETEIEIESMIYGAKGTELTCQIQGVFMQIGITGIFFFFSLTIYYLCTIRFGFRENRMNGLRWYFLLPPLFLGILYSGMGFAELDFSYVACYGEVEELGGEVLPKIPFWVSFLATPVALFLTLQHVYQTDRAANKWRFSTQESSMTSDSQFETKREAADFSGLPSSLSSVSTDSVNAQDNAPKTMSSVALWSGEGAPQKPPAVRSQNEETAGSNFRDQAGSSFRSNSSRTAQTVGSTGSNPPNQLTRAVFWQFFLYLMSFWFTWPVFFLGKIDALETNFAYLILVVTITPLQGFFNAFVYFRPTVAKEYERWKQTKKSKRSAGKNTSGSDKRAAQPALQSIPEADEEEANQQKLDHQETST